MKTRDSVPAATALILLLLYTLGVFGHDLWTPDEPRVAAVGRQVAEGAWVVPKLNGSPFLEQPPLHAWCVAVVYKLFGYEPPEIGRVVSAVFGIGGLAVTYLLAFHLARSMGDRAARRVGAFAALTLGLSLEYLNTAHRVIVDGALTFFTTTSAYALLRGCTTQLGRSRALWFTAAYVFASLAFLSKGAIGLAVPGLALLAIAFALREPRSLLRAHLILALVCFILVTGGWFYLLYQETGLEGFKEIFIKNTLGRALPRAAGEAAHTKPFYFYLGFAPLHLFPATLFFAGAIVRRLRDRSAIDAVERFAYDFSLAWFGAGFVLLSVATTKRPVYLVPLFPAAAVAGGFWLEAFVAKQADSFYERWIGQLLAAILFLFSAALPIGAYFLKSDGLAWAVVGALCGIGAALALWIASGRGQREAVVLLFAAGIVLVSIPSLFSILPAIDAMKSLGPVSRRIASLVPPDRQIVAIKPDETTEGMIPFYTGRALAVVPTVEELERSLAAGTDVYLLTIDKKAYEPGSGAWKSSEYGRVEHLPHELLLEDLGAGSASRAFHLLRVHASK